MKLYVKGRKEKDNIELIAAEVELSEQIFEELNIEAQKEHITLQELMISLISIGLQLKVGNNYQIAD